MAGRPRKNNVSMEEMIKHQEDAVEKAKSKYDSVESSGKTFEEIIEFLTEGKN